VANIYYIQPLLSTIAASFRISVPQVGIVAMLTQFGAALGMLVFVPLGDTKERRRLIVCLLVAESVCLAAMASAQNFCLAGAGEFWHWSLRRRQFTLSFPSPPILASPAAAGRDDRDRSWRIAVWDPAGTHF